MATFSGSVSYSTLGSVEDLADNDFRMISQNGVLGQFATLELTDMYPSANFTFGFELTASEDPSTTVIPFIITFYDIETRLKFNFNTNASQTAFSVVMENDVEGLTQSYTLYSANHPSLYPASSTKILIRILNGFLWVKVGSTFWLTKHDIQGHPLHLEGGIIQFSLTNSTVLVSHRIQNIYFEPILCIQDQTYFSKGIFPEAYENFTVSDITDTSNLRLNPNDLKINIPVGANLLYVGGLTDVEWKNDISGTTVQRKDYPQLANGLGVPMSRSSFYVPYPSATFNQIAGDGGNITNIQRTNLKGFGDQGRFYVGNSSTGYLSPINNMTWDSSTGLSLTSTLTVNRLLGASYNDLSDKPTTGQVNADWNSTTDPSRILNKPALATVATTGSYTDLINTPTTSLPTGIITMWYGTTTNVPSGWALCNGLNGTPDLRDRFILGAGTTYTAGTTGGSSTATLSVSNMPSHTHTGTTNSGEGTHTHTLTDPGHSHSGGVGNTGYNVPAQTSGYAILASTTTGSATTGISVNSTNSAHQHTFTTGSTGSGSSFSIMPPYYVLCFIMKL